MKFEPTFQKGYIQKSLLCEEGAAYAAAEMLQKSEGAQSLVLLAGSEHQALVWKAQIAYFSPTLEVQHFPARDVLLYDEISPREETTYQRLTALEKINTPHAKHRCIILSLSALLERIAPPSFLLSRSLNFHQGQTIEPSDLAKKLIKSGYFAVPDVMSVGEFSQKGEIFELFPMGAKAPVRLTFFDNEIESIRFFDAQRLEKSTKVDAVELASTREYPTDTHARREFLARYETAFPQTPIEKSSLSPLLRGQDVAGMESYLPLYFEGMSSIFDYLPEDAIWFVPSNPTLKSRIQQIESQATLRFARAKKFHHAILPPSRLLLSADEIFAGFKAHERFCFAPHEGGKKGILSLQKAMDSGLFPKVRALEELKELSAEGNAQISVHIFAGSSGRAHRIVSDLNALNMDACYAHTASERKDAHTILVSPFECLWSFYDAQKKIALISDQDIGMVRDAKRAHPQKIPAMGKDLMPGDFVVHQDYGIGRFQGIQTIEEEGVVQDFIQIEYQHDAVLSASMEELGRIYRYENDDEPPNLGELGDKSWEQAKKAAQKRIDDVSAKLLHAYAQRRTKKGFAFTLDVALYRSFEESFPYQPTIDQKSAIEATLLDMQKATPMDRLICGDVGLGKTEVAFRAMFVAMMNAKQVAFLVPTTLLCEQHYERAAERFGAFGVNVAVLSRFQSAKESKQILQELEQGSIDMIIGTHRLLSTKVKFKDLGLLVVDEEQRFGVQQKERLRKQYPQVDTLIMSATPIPRTLQMALSSWQDFSIIATPPQHRLPIRTFYTELDSDRIAMAMFREIKRGGQVYYLYNDVVHIDEFAQRLGRELGDEVKIAVLHGQLKESEIERIMLDFQQHRYNVLVCSTIIETGIDIANVNTILIHRAERFGLAQLHQLRGRVGRSHHQGYCYLVCPQRKMLKNDQARRIEALMQHQEIGSGFVLSSKDLDIRGAGDFLGASQSGHIKSISFSLYLHMLEATIERLKSGIISEAALEDLNQESARVEIKMDQYLESDYVQDPGERLLIYQKLLDCKTPQAVDAFMEEILEKYGEMPAPSVHLFAFSKLRARCESLQIQSIAIGKKSILCTPGTHANVNTERLIDLIQKNPQRYKIASDASVVFFFEDESLENLEKISQAHDLLSVLLES